VKEQDVKPMYWVGSSKKDLKSMPTSVQDTFGFALHLAQTGKTHPSAKTLRGFGSAAVVEVVESAVGGTYRAVYTVKFSDAIYVLHCFQKKSTHGIATPKPDIDMIHARLKAARMHAEGNQND
jgi:phage-related protein